MNDRFSKENKDKLLKVPKHNGFIANVKRWVFGFFLFQVVPVLSPVIWVLVAYLLNLPSIFINIVLFFLIPVTFYFLYLIFIKFNDVKIKTYEFKLEKIKDRFEFLFVTDLHIGKEFYSTRESRLRNIINQINSTNLGLIVFGGDFIEHKIEKSLLDMLSQITIPIKIAVCGNHDSYYLDAKNIEENLPQELIFILEKLGIKMLLDTSITAKTGQDVITFFGITDLYTKLFNITEAQKESDKTDVKILISHNPDIVDFVEDKDDIDLILSGHTHGAQIFLNKLIRLPMPVKNTQYRSGIHNIGQKTKLFISEGIGHSGTRIRIGTECEICRIVLIPA